MRYQFFPFFILFILGKSLFAQDYNLGVPMLQAFPKDITQSGSQNSDMVQDKHGVMYFANNEGLLIYDGTTWKVYPLPNYTIVRSIAITDNGTIYAGGQNEFGRYFPNQEGVWEFESLRHLIPEEQRNFEDVWQIEEKDNEIFFIASNRLFHLKDDKIRVHFKGTITSLNKANNQIFVQDIFTGLYYFSNNKLELINGSEIFIEKGVEGIIKRKNDFLIATLKNGFYNFSENKFEKWKTDADQFINENHIHEITNILGNRIAIGTDFGGLLILDSLGKTIHHLHKGNGLLSNNFLSMYFDKSKNLWLGLNNGINYIHTNSPFTRIFPDKDQDGIGFGVKIHNNKIYFATNKGLYYSDWKEHYNPLQSIDYQEVMDLKGQVWGLDIVNNQLFAAHNRGAFLIENNTSSHFYNLTGIWNFDKVNNNPDLMLAGSYNNLLLFEKENDSWKTISNDLLLNESSRFVEQDEFGNFWVSHPYRGIYKINFSSFYTKPKVELFGEANGLPSDILNHLFKIKNKIIFCGEKGVYNFNYDKNRFEINPSFTKTFGEKTKIRRLHEAPNGDIWFVTKDEFGILKIVDVGLEKDIKKIVFPFFNQELNQGFESIYTLDDENVFITNDRGFIHYHPSDFMARDTTFNVLINEIKITSIGDSIISKGLFVQDKKLYRAQNEEEIPFFSYDLNDFHFNFTSTDFVSGTATKYRYFLEGDDKDWLDWNSLNAKEYTNLSPGTYTFHVQAKNNFQTLSNVLTYKFKIKPPWYKSKLAYGIYTLLLFFGLATIIRIYQKKYSGLKEDHIQVVKQSEETIGKLKAEKIETELEFKKRELVSTTLNLVKKNETITDIKEQLKEIKKDVKEKEPAQQIEKLIKKLKIEEVQDENWEQVMFHFNQLNKDFFDTLNNDYPMLTPKDLKMCAYLRMNLSTKEMTSLLNVTTRGVEASRYRLRKKFGLEKDQNLTEFLMRF